MQKWSQSAWIQQRYLHNCQNNQGNTVVSSPQCTSHSLVQISRRCGWWKVEFVWCII